MNIRTKRKEQLDFSKFSFLILLLDDELSFFFLWEDDDELSWQVSSPKKKSWQVSWIIINISLIKKWGHKFYFHTSGVGGIGGNC